MDLPLGTILSALAFRLTVLNASCQDATASPLMNTFPFSCPGDVGWAYPSSTPHEARCPRRKALLQAHFRLGSGSDTICQDPPLGTILSALAFRLTVLNASCQDATASPLMNTFPFSCPGDVGWAYRLIPSRSVPEEGPFDEDVEPREGWMRGKPIPHRLGRKRGRYS
ncbi:hypothetical protein F0562_007587 [Nyssa sinensis]|uniref:Uncharacterized protein n=1 Tax=Nyssa sinensis TaxID=561372 RepID=A0A5J5A784_9ASTE|nr:hypothetical protein F0562_007587 [Nyssa sinensis]